MKTILTVGGSGFVGSQFILKSKYDQIHNIYNNTPAKCAHKNTHISRLVSEEIKPAPDVIVNFSVKYEDNRVLDIIDANISLTAELIRICEEYNVNRYISLNSFSAKPGTYAAHIPKYSASKKLQSAILQEAAIDTLSLTELYLEHIYGPGDSSKKFIPWVLAKIRNDDTVKLKAPNDQRDFVYVDDLVRLIDILIDDPIESGYRHYEVGTGKTNSVYELVYLMKTLAKSKSKIACCSSSQVSDLPFSCARDNYMHPQWVAETSLRDGLIEMLSYEY